MKKLYCFICGKYRKFQNPKIFIFEKTSAFSISKNENEKNIYQKFLVYLKIYNYFQICLKKI